MKLNSGIIIHLGATVRCIIRVGTRPFEASYSMCEVQYMLIHASVANLFD